MNNFICLCQNSNIFAFVDYKFKIFCRILVSFKYRKFQSHNSKAMAKDKEVNMTVTNLKARVIFPLQVIFGQVKYLWVNSLVFFGAQ
jgi:hypothetical protein